MLTPKGCYFANILGIGAAAAVSFAISVFLLKFFGKDSSLAEAQAQVAASKAASKGQAAPAATGASVSAKDVKKIVFACDAGMGSSAMGAPEYDALVEELAARGTAQTASTPAEAEEKTGGKPILVERKNILLNCESEAPEDIIRRCGRMMVDSGYATEDYIEGMIQRNREFSVAIGCYVAIPHGVEHVRHCVKKTGLVVMTYPQGIQWDDEMVKLVIGIAALGEEHMDVLTVISEIAGSEEDTDALVSGADVDTLYKKLNGLA